MRAFITIFFLSVFLFPAAILLFTASEINPEDAIPAYQNTSLPVEERIEDLIQRMTVEEKITMLGGTGFTTQPVERLGIPPLNMCDGPMGTRFEGPATCFPAGIMMASAWDTTLIKNIASVMAKETRFKGRHVLLAPCINILRTPFGGRNFESYGEDPYLTSRLAVAFVNGLQNERIAASTKHFAVNNQEWERTSIDVHVDERTMREIYLPAFEAAVKEANSWTVMSAYNKINGYHATENNILQNKILKDEWGFKGLVVSDWGATHSSVPCALNGLDLEMPTGIYFNADSLMAAVKSSVITEAVLNDKIRRILRVLFWTGAFDDPKTLDPGAFDTPQHRETARKAAEDGIVLLKNDNAVLPLPLNKMKTIAVIGPNAAVNRFGGGGSSALTPSYSIAPLDALKEKLGSSVALTYELGCKNKNDIDVIPSSFLSTLENGVTVEGLTGYYFNNMTLEGEPALIRTDKQINFEWSGDTPADNIGSDNFSVRWKGKLQPAETNVYQLGLIGDDGYRLYLNGEKVIDHWSDHAAEARTFDVTLEAGKSYEIVIEFYENRGDAVIKFGWSNGNDMLLSDAVNAAKKSDYALVFVGLNASYESEGFDRISMKLPDNQITLINEVAKVNKNTIVILNNGSPIDVSDWMNNVEGIVEAWFPGQEGGNAIANVLLGIVNPSGKLPCTFPARYEDNPTISTYPGKNGSTTYEEGIWVGYRYYEKKNIKPLFPFGFGLSYTTFEYSNPVVSVAKKGDKNIAIVSFEIKNTGLVAGAEIAQLYIRDKEASVERPDKELKRFAKVFLKPGESKTVSFTLDARAFSFWDIDSGGWKMEAGTYDIIIGSSSTLIKFTETITL